MYIILNFMKFMGRDGCTGYYLWMALQDFLKTGKDVVRYLVKKRNRERNDG